MNSILIVLPILTLLMFDLGLSLEGKDFLLVFKRPKAVLAGMAGQLILLPILAFCLCLLFNIPPHFAIGMMLIACCPGGSSSNVFSKLAKGDVALSVSLTAISSIITLVTMPFIMQWASAYFGRSVNISLPVGNLLVQNLITMLLPIIIGLVVRKYAPKAAAAISKVLSKLAFPLLMLLAALFFIGNKAVIIEYFALLGTTMTIQLIASICLALLLCVVLRLKKKEQRTIIIEVGMQNAAQAIAIGTSPFIFNDATIATPAIIYALMMNVVLLIYVGFTSLRKNIAE